MTDKIGKTIKYIDEWKTKGWTESADSLFQEDLPKFLEQLKLTHADAEDILGKLNAKIAEESETNKNNLSNEFTQFASDFFVVMIEDFRFENKDENTLGYLIKEGS